MVLSYPAVSTQLYTLFKNVHTACKLAIFCCWYCRCFHSAKLLSYLRFLFQKEKSQLEQTCSHAKYPKRKKKIAKMKNLFPSQITWPKKSDTKLKYRFVLSCLVLYCVLSCLLSPPNNYTAQFDNNWCGRVCCATAACKHPSSAMYVPLLESVERIADEQKKKQLIELLQIDSGHILNTEDTNSVYNKLMANSYLVFPTSNETFLELLLSCFSFFLFCFG